MSSYQMIQHKAAQIAKLGWESVQSAEGSILSKFMLYSRFDFPAHSISETQTRKLHLNQHPNFSLCCEKKTVSEVKEVWGLDQIGNWNQSVAADPNSKLQIWASWQEPNRTKVSVSPMNFI